ncbi:MAG: hypothetical protein LBO68_03075, partial [Synergistaceae bacterium]|nr:hypothetical protein [Synergistaceae bacterium]
MKTAKTQILLTVMTAVFLTAAFSEGAGAATFDVTTRANSGAGSLRQAISYANANDEADVINIAPAVKEIYLSNAVEITGDVVVNGGGATVRGSKVSRLFGIAGGTVKFDRLTFTDGYPLSDSGGVAYIDSSAAAAAFVNCTFFGNRAGKSGGAVYLYGGGNRPTTFVNCTLTNNEAAESGGGVAILGGTVQFDASIITGNRAPSDPEIHRGSNGHVSNLGQYNVVGQTSVQDVFSTISNNVSVPASDVFKTPGLLGTVDGVQVVELNTNNVALDKIPIANALSLPSVDERGVPRPQMGAIDAGAYELSPVALASVDLRGVSYIEVLGSENFAAVPQPENATLDVRTYRNGLSWSVINPSNAEVLSVDQGGAVAALAEGVATLKVEAYGWDVSGNK